MRAIGNYGRFANGVWQVCGVIGIARRNGLTPVFPLWRNTWHRDAFGGTEDIDIYNHLVNPLPLIPENVAFTDRTVEWGFNDTVLPAGNWNLSGHFQSERYFEHCIDEVRWQLQMKDEPPRSDYCGMHVRRGDYDDQYHPRVPESYYREAMRHVVGPYLVFSDDIAECKKMFGTDVEYSEGRDYLTDFKLLKSCSRFIIGNSSYGAIAAVLSDAPGKQVVAPRPWFGPAYTRITGEDICSDGWKVIDWK